MRREAGRRVVFAAGVCLLAAGCAIDATGALPVPLPPAAPRLELAAEADHVALVRALGGEARAPAAGALLDDIAARLVARSGRPTLPADVTILDTPGVNAFALPSGRLYVTRGLLALANDSSEIAAVLAHEIGHLVRDHAAIRGEMEARATLVSRVETDVLGNPDAAARNRDTSRATLAGFSREQEYEADAVSVRIMADAGFDPGGALRALTALGRSGDLARRDGDDTPDRLATHPDTATRITRLREAVRRVGAVPGARTDRERYLAAIDGLAWGDKPSDGMVRGRRFVHPRLGIAFEAPAGFTLENTPSAVMGWAEKGDRRLLFDAVDGADLPLGEVMRTSWSEALDAGTIREGDVNGNPAVFATSRGAEWRFQLAALRVGRSAFRMILASKNDAPASETEFAALVATIRPVAPTEAASLRPQRVEIVTAGAADTAASFAARMGTDRAAERFAVLNGLGRDEPVRAGQRYKLVSD